VGAGIVELIFLIFGLGSLSSLLDSSAPFSPNEEPPEGENTPPAAPTRLVNGTDGNDTLDGALSEKDVIYGFGGDDVLMGGDTYFLNQGL
jgi:hypothetical protein